MNLQRKVLETMIDNSQDKGYITVYLKKVGDEYHLCESRIYQEDDETPFYVDYEDGKIFVIFGDNKEIIGSYETTPGPYGSKVFDYPSKRVIGLVGGELIYFRRKDEDFAAGRYLPEQECLAYYTKNGTITAVGLLPRWGNIIGSEIGGAAAFVALFYNYGFKSVFRDYFIMDDNSFKEKYAAYLNPLGL